MKRHILSLAVLLLACTLVSAQSLRGSYFFETSPQRGKMNAAFAPQVNYVSVPLLGAVGVETWSNAGLGQFVFPTGGSLKTFMHPDISADSFLSALPDGDPYLKERLEMDLLGGGFRLGANGYASIGVSVLEDGSVLVPKEFLRFAKLNENGSYPGPQVSGRIYGALSLGYSHDLGDLVEGLRVGGRVKLLSGLYAGDIDLRKIEIGIDAEQVSAATEGEGHLPFMDKAKKDEPKAVTYRAAASKPAAKGSASTAKEPQSSEVPTIQDPGEQYHAKSRN